jgi:predicted transcriptional regulator
VAVKIAKQRLLKILLYMLIFCGFMIFLLNITNFINKSADTFMVENGTLSYEEEAEGYIIRDETVLKGANYSNGLSQIVREGTRVSKNEAVFRYYSNKEEEITKQIEELDKQIDEALETNKKNINSSNDIINLETEIKDILEKMYEENNCTEIDEYEKRINTYIVKKAEIAGDLSPAGSYIKTLVEQRNTLSNQLTADSETVTSPSAGVISYKVDGLEDVLTYNNQDFSYINFDLLEGLSLNVGASIPESKEARKNC